ncbi:MAG: class I SAM-dependent methyltransferase [Spirochaetaceae bacterium]
MSTASERFYAVLAPYYDALFPPEPEVVSFLSESGAKPGARVADVACGTGLYSEELLNRGVDAWGLDASPDLVDAARRRTGRPERFLLGDMRDLSPLDGIPGGSRWDLIYCIGHSVVHLPSLGAVETFLDEALGRLGAGATGRGTLVLQWVELSGLAVGETRNLPPLTAGPVEMQRFHTRITEDSVRFDIRVLEAGETVAETSNRLLLLRDSDVLCYLAGRGLETELYGGFEEQPVAPESWVRVARARAGDSGVSVPGPEAGTKANP